MSSRPADFPKQMHCCIVHKLRVMVQNPKHRATATQILQHEWMRENGTASERPLNNVILQRMRVFANHNLFKKKALQVIASTMNAEEIAGLRSLFQVKMLPQVKLH